MYIDINEEKLGKIRLNKYQYQTVNEMINLESNNCINTNDEQLISEFGILGNKVGSGKSYCILGLISNKQKLDIQPIVKYQFNNKKAAIKLQPFLFLNIQWTQINFYNKLIFQNISLLFVFFQVLA